MNKILSLLLLSVSLLGFATIAEAQDTDGFSSNESMIGKRIRLYDAVTLYQEYGAFVYAKISDNYVKIKDISAYQTIESSLVKVKGVVSDKKDQYLQVKYEDSDSSFYWILDNTHKYYSYACDIDYWDRTLERLREDYAYIKYPSRIVLGNIDTTTMYGRYKMITAQQEIKSNLLLDRFLPVTWISYKVPSTRFEAVKLECQLLGKTRIFTLIEIMQDKESFASKKDYAAVDDARKEAENWRDSIVLCEAIIRQLLTTNDKLIEEYNHQDTLYFSVFECIRGGIKSNHYRGYVLGQEIVLPDGALQFTDISSRSFVKSRGETGRETRRQVARQNDSIRSQEYRLAKNKREAEKIEREKKAQKQLEEIYRFRKQKQIVILSCTTVRSAPTKGLEVRVYNPFDKEIKYFYIKTIAINAVNDPETDDIGRSEKEVKCIGFVEKGEECTYRFEDLYWDKKDILHRIIISNIRIVFSDNTSISFSGKAQVESHMEHYYAKELLRLIGDDPIDVSRQELSYQGSRETFPVINK